MLFFKSTSLLFCNSNIYPYLFSLKKFTASLYNSTILEVEILSILSKYGLSDKRSEIIDISAETKTLRSGGIIKELIFFIKSKETPSSC